MNSPASNGQVRSEAMNLLRHCALALGTALSLLAAGAAWGEAGKVVFAVGDVALRGTARVPLAAGATLEVGDTIVTAAQSHAQLRFTDDALVALKPESEFRIEQYNFDGRQDGTEV